MNLRSMYDRNCNERGIVDLIWFPTGGGKTEAYLGLSAYTIFIRRLMNKDDKGTAILMRYTLRLLTAQQYERASAMICACDLIRNEHVDLFGKNRITIGLWVGSATTPNSIKAAVKAYEKLYNGGGNNPFPKHFRVIPEALYNFCGRHTSLILTHERFFKLNGKADTVLKNSIGIWILL